MQAQQMATWLKSLKNIQDVHPVKVTLNGQDFFGARYKMIGHYTASMQAVQQGKRKEGETYETDCLELVGRRPFTIKKRTRFCFPFENMEWYISHYYTDETITEYHPFGPSFGMRAWDAPGKIDTYESKPYLRVDMKLENL